jgi:TetR/AcrR family transcriptional repressor of nem operon
MVGRPREFDPDTVLEAAMRAFWAKGYEATSLADLMAVTGLHKGSLYQAFGDKHSLFVQALTRYLEDMGRQADEIAASAETPLDAMQQVLHRMIDIVDSHDDCPMGCLAINSLVELAPHDPEVKKVLHDHLEQMKSSMRQKIAEAQAAGQISTHRSPELITGLLSTFIAGLGANMKGMLSKAEAHELMDEQIKALTC